MHLNFYLPVRSGLRASKIVLQSKDVLPNRTLVLVLGVGAACRCCVTAWHDATATAGDPAFGLFGWSGTCACIRCHGLHHNNGDRCHRVTAVSSELVCTGGFEKGGGARIPGTAACTAVCTVACTAVCTVACTAACTAVCTAACTD